MGETMMRRVAAMATMEGAGVTVHRTIGTPSLKNLDPFLMLDHFGTDNPEDYIAGFPDHPHRGFCTFTYMIEGHMEHKDSMGNTGNLTAGSAQWMKAGSGVIHSEMPQQENGAMRGFQLWINLPADQKMTDPAYQEFSSSAFPVVEEENQKVKILIGEYKGTQAPISDDNTDVVYVDVSQQAGATFELELPKNQNSFLYMFEGSGSVNDTQLDTHNLLAIYQSGQIKVTAGNNGARFILVSGRPIGESIVQYGPFAMNTRAEIEQAIHDYHAGRLVQKKAAMKTD